MGGDIDFTLPVAENTEYDQAGATPMGQAMLRDAGTAVYGGWVVWAGAGKANIRRHSVSGSNISITVISSTTPFTWASGDQIIAQGFYEAA